MSQIALTVDGIADTVTVEDRTTLADCLRDHLGCTTVKVGCEQGICGACTVAVGGRLVRACLMLAVQADGSEVVTAAGLERMDPQRASALQDAFREAHGVQCGFCTAGMIMTAHALLGNDPDPSEASVRDAIHGNLCRCTGYQQIVEAVQMAAGTIARSDEDAT